MPSFKTHLIIGWITTLLLSVAYLAKIKNIPLNFPGLLDYVTSNPWWTIPLAFALVSIGSVLPDIDHPNSMTRWLVTVLGLIGIIVSVFLKRYIYVYIIAAVLLFIWLWKLTHKLEHRGWIHTMIMAAIFAFPLFFYIAPIFVALFFIAYNTHLLADALLKSSG